MVDLARRASSASWRRLGYRARESPLSAAPDHRPRAPKRPSASSELGRLIEDNADFESGLSTVYEVVVFASELGPDGPTYEPLGHADLKGQLKAGPRVKLRQACTAGCRALAHKSARQFGIGSAKMAARKRCERFCAKALAGRGWAPIICTCVH